MNKKILLNDKEFNFTENDLPCLINGEHGSGASLFTVSLVAELYSKGSKILFLCGYHMARDEFVAQTNATDTIIVEKPVELNKLSAKVIFVKRETPELFISAINNLHDIDERIIIIKNFELFNQELFEAVKDRERVIISGDLDQCSYRELLFKNKWKTKIFFSQPKGKVSEIPNLDKFEGYLLGENREGKLLLK